MENLIAFVTETVDSVDWENPVIFLIVFLMMAAVFRRWSLLMVTVLTLMLGSLAGGLIIMRISTGTTVIGLPMVIYSIGGLTVVTLLLYTFYKS